MAQYCINSDMIARAVRGAALAALALFAAGAVTPVAAQEREESVGRIGSGTVVRIFSNNRFNRCSASFSNPQMLRITFTASRKYGISVPPVRAARGEPLIIAVSSTNSPTFATDGQTNGRRSWSELDLVTIEAMMNFRGPLIVQAGTSRFQWSLGTSVQNVLMAIENCTNRALGGR